MNQVEFDNSPWASKTEKIFSDLSVSKHPKLRSLSATKNDVIRQAHRVNFVLFSTAIAVALASPFVNVIYEFSEWLLKPWTIFTACLLCLAFFVFFVCNSKHYRLFSIIRVLSFAGVSIAVGKKDVEALKQWTDQYPQLVPILGKWMASNPDRRLNMYDLLAAQVAVIRVFKIEQQELEAKKAYADKLEAERVVTEQLREMGITAVAHHQLLGEIADEAGPREQEAPRAL